jgi:TatA/E family protein of Tat protein translocase
MELSPLHLILILIIALLILGPGKLPDVGAALGKSIREFRKATSDIQDSVRVDTSPLPPAPQPAPPVAAPAPIAAVAAAPSPLPAAPVATSSEAEATGTQP